MDAVSTEKRSAIMRSIKSKNTSPEKILRKAMWGLGLRGWRNNYSQLIGKPDVVFSKYKLAIFVDGCFWHGCPTCCKKPSSNIAYWQDKIERNKQKDTSVTSELQKQSWKVIRFWEHDVNGKCQNCALLIKQELDNLKNINL